MSNENKIALSQREYKIWDAQTNLKAAESASRQKVQRNVAKPSEIP